MLNYDIFHLICRTQPEPEVIYLKHVEQQKQQTKKEEVVEKFGAPSFLTPLRDQAINEGERIHFEAKISPLGDPSMKVEWYFNGAAIPASKWRKRVQNEK